MSIKKYRGAFALSPTFALSPIGQAFALLPLAIVTFGVYTAPSTRSLPIPFPYGVADLNQHAGFVGTPEGKIEALNLNTGKQLWLTVLAARPLVVTGNLLIAQGAFNPDRLFVLDLSHAGSVKPTPILFPLPRWVTPSTSISESFALRAEANGSKLIIRWEAHKSPGGTRKAGVTGESSLVQGMVSVDLITRHTSTLPTQEPLKLPQLSISRPADKESSLQDLAASEEWLVDGRAYRLQQYAEGKSQTLALVRTSSQHSASPSSAPLAKGFNIGANVTPDGKFLLVHSDPEPGGTSGMVRWEIFAVERATRIGSVTTSAVMIEPCIIGNTIYFVTRVKAGTLNSYTSSTLHAVNFTTSQEIWQHDLGKMPVVRHGALPP
jgi:hypothetical protein